WKPLAAAGFRNLTAIPIYGPMGHCDVFTVIADEPSPSTLRVGLLDELILVAYNLAVFFRSQDSGPKTIITHREAECLQWTARGKTAWEVGQILDISERTARFHLRNAMQKLDASSKHQAVLKALQSGMIAL